MTSIASVPSSYSFACAMKASRFISSIFPPPASFMNIRIEAIGSWLASSPARSLDSSLFRYHSSSAIWIGRSAMPARNGRFRKPNSRMMKRIVR